MITAPTDAEHLRRISLVLQRLGESGLRVKKEKCEFMRDKIEYLGHVVDKNGIHTSPEKVEAIRKMPAPQNLKELQSFLGMLNYYGKFVPAMATISEPLNELRRSGSKWQWGHEQQKAFEQIKERLASSEVLVHYDPEKPLYLAADASDYGMGAVLFHKDAKTGKVGVIAYASKTLNPAERNYAQIEKEGRSIVFGVEKFNQYLYGRKFVLQTDHEPLKKIFGPKGELPIVAARRLHRWSLILMNYDFEMEYCSTKEFGNADGLSRLPAPELETIDAVSREVQEVQSETLSSLPVSAEGIAEETRKDPILKLVKQYLERGWPQKCAEESLKPFHLARNDLELTEGCILLGTRTVIPAKFRAKMLDLLHATHPGIVRMKSLARQKIWWPGIDKDIEMIRKKCKTCQSDAPEERKVPLHPWETPDEPWQRLHIDFCGPFWGSMWLVVVDAKSKWPEVVQMKSTTTGATIKALRIVFGTHGLPQQIVSDNGPQFTAREFRDFCRSRGIEHTLIAPYNPKSNGIAERFVQTFKQGMRRMQTDGWTVDLILSQFLLKYRVTPHPATGKSPSEMLFGRKLRTLLDLVKPRQKTKEIEREGNAYEERKRRNFDQNKREKSFEIGQPIFARNFRDGPKWLQGRILQKIGAAMFLIRTPRGLWRRHFDQLKPDFTDQTRDDSDSESEQGSIGGTSDGIDPPEAEEQEFHSAEEDQEPEIAVAPEIVPPQPRVGDRPPLRRSERTRKPRKIFEPE